MADARNTDSNIFLDHPGVIGVLVAIACVVVFVGALYMGQEGGEHEHGAAAASSAPVKGAAPAAPASAPAASAH